MDTSLRLPDAFATGDVVLRLPTEQDVGRITEICQDPDIQRFTRVAVPYRREHAESLVSMANDSLDGGRGAHLLVEVDGAVVGCTGVYVDRTDEIGVVGYWTAPEARRQGITTTAVRMLCAWAFDDLGLARLELSTAATNPGSNAVARSLGFTCEGTRRSAMLLSPIGDTPSTRVDVNDWGLLPGELR